MANTTSTLVSKRVINRLFEPACARFTVGMLISSVYYVYLDTTIEKIVDELSNNDKIFALAVVDKSMQVSGIIIRKDLFDILGRRFGRELYYNKTAADMLQKVQLFDYTMHIFECSKLIEKDLLTGVQDYYALVDENGCYKGLFSTKDMLIFLSRLTQIDIEQAKRVINRMIKKQYELKTKRLTVSIRNELVQDIGGDSYFIIPSKKENQLIVAICDVAGKGVAASMITTLINGMVTTYDFNSSDIDTFLVHLNNYIFSTFEGEKFVTACFMVFNEDNGILTLYDFGHSMTYLYRGNNVYKLALKEIKDCNMPLGIQKITAMHSGKINLESGDTIITITDGCVEQRDVNCKEYGIQRFNKVFVSSYSDDLAKTLHAIMTDIQNFRTPYPQLDDITIACVRYE
ncbi:MAG TPA: SpoIIE family protein phosphatase [Spirochaetota bacterium]|nr:SpoIIE family protein phosphatase [Spirochaetota bacterium]